MSNGKIEYDFQLKITEETKNRILAYPTFSGRKDGAAYISKILTEKMSLVIEQMVTSIYMQELGVNTETTPRHIIEPILKEKDGTTTYAKDPSYKEKGNGEGKQLASDNNHKETLSGAAFIGGATSPTKSLSNLSDSIDDSGTKISAVQADDDIDLSDEEDTSDVQGEFNLEDFGLSDDAGNSLESSLGRAKVTPLTE